MRRYECHDYCDTHKTAWPQQPFQRNNSHGKENKKRKEIFSNSHATVEVLNQWPSTRGLHGPVDSILASKVQGCWFESHWGSLNLLMYQYFQKIVDSADSDYGKVMEKIEDAAILKVYQ